MAIIKRYEKDNKKQDVTNDIEHIEETNTSYYITYKNGFSGHDKKSNIEILNCFTEIDILNKVLLHNNAPLHKLLKVLRFGSFIRVFFSDSTIKSYPSNEIHEVSIANGDDNAIHYLSYINEVADFIEKDKDIVKGKLKNLALLNDSVLYRFLNNRKANITEGFDSNKVIFPFGYNLAQKSAVINALKSDMSLIQGPPGTGKTQTILNIIANLIVNNKTVAVVSGNNEAITNVKEKLAAVNLDFITAFLGKKDNIKDFFLLNHDFPEICESWKTEIIDIKKAETRLLLLSNKTSNLLQYKIDISKLQNQISELNIEKANSESEFYAKNNLTSKILNKHYTLNSVLELKARLLLLNKKRLKRFPTKLNFLFSFGIFSTSKHFKNKADVLNFLDLQYYNLKLAALGKELESKALFIKEHNLDELLEESRAISFAILKKSVVKNQLTQNCSLDNTNYQSHFNTFLKRFPIVFSTTHALSTSSAHLFLYDYVIIDESSQVDMASATIALSCAKNIVLVGDLKQLPHVLSSDKNAIKEIFKRYKLPSNFEFAANSILQSFAVQYGNSIPNTLLNEHYRCDPEIIGFCNKRFYDDKLIVRTEHKPGNGIHILYTESNHARCVVNDKGKVGWINERQADVIEKDILPLIQITEPCIISPFRFQTDLLTNKFKDANYPIDTVHKFQGKERDIVIISTVKDRIKNYSNEAHEPTNDFLDNPNLLNVALSRAKSKLFVIMSKELINQKGTILSDFSHYTKYFCSEGKIEKTSVYSILDLQYKDFSPILESFRKQLKIISNFAGENIIWTAITNICKSNDFGILDCVHNYPLQKLVRAETIKDCQDKAFLLNPNTHCDFVIFDKLDKSIKMVVELDGMQHLQKSQNERDEKKNRILSIAKIPLLRLTTTASACTEKIEAVLKNLNA